MEPVSRVSVWSKEPITGMMFCLSVSWYLKVLGIGPYDIYQVLWIKSCIKENANTILYSVTLNVFTWRLDTPTAAITPNITRNMPPMTGSGIVIKIAPNFPKIPRMIIRIPAVWRTNLLPTYSCIKKEHMYSQYGAHKKASSFILTILQAVWPFSSNIWHQEQFRNSQNLNFNSDHESTEALLWFYKFKKISVTAPLVKLYMVIS